MPRDNGLDGGFHRSGIPIVGANGNRLAAGLLDFGNQRIGLCLRLPVGDGDNGALACQPPGDCSTDAASAARHQRHLVLQIRHAHTPYL
ncbi:hypothetical protein D3C87_1878620 [compost metagenome]